MRVCVLRDFASGLLLITGVLVTGGTVADATTSDNAGLPPPARIMPIQDGDPFLGRFYLMRVGRQAHIISGQLDIEVQGQEEEERIGSTANLS